MNHKSNALKHRLIDPSDYKRNTIKNKAHSRVMDSFGGYKGYDTGRNEELRAAIKPVYKSIDRKEARSIQKGGRKSVKNMKGKVGYFKHLTERARRRGEEDL